MTDLDTLRGIVPVAEAILKTLAGKARPVSYISAEQSLKACITRAADTQTWAVSDAHALYIAAVLHLHDDQLRVIPVPARERQASIGKAAHPRARVPKLRLLSGHPGSLGLRELM